MRVYVENIHRSLSDCIAKALYDDLELNRAKVFDYFNLSAKTWRLNFYKAMMDFNKSDKGELAHMKYKSILSGVLDDEDLKKIDQDLKEDD